MSDTLPYTVILDRLWLRLCRWSAMSNIWKDIPIAARVFTVLGGAVLFGMLASELFALPARMDVMEAWRIEQVDPAMKYLVCSQAAENDSRDPRPCDAILRDLPELLQLTQ